MARIIRDAGAFTLKPGRGTEPWQALTRAVASQQLHGNAARAIFGRFLALYPGKKFPAPADIAATPFGKLRGTGFSEAKVKAVCDIAEKAAAGQVPTRKQCARMTDAEIIAACVPLRGVGRWTVEMLLIFTLGRMDVLPVDDFGVREGYRLAYGLRKQPKPKVLAKIGEKWAPYRSVAAWYLWRAADLAKEKRVLAKKRTSVKSARRRR